MSSKMCLCILKNEWEARERERARSSWVREGANGRKITSEWWERVNAMAMAKATARERVRKCANGSLKLRN